MCVYIRFHLRKTTPYFVQEKILPERVLLVFIISFALIGCASFDQSVLDDAIVGHGRSGGKLSGEFKIWHKLTITFDGPRYTATDDEGANRRTTTGDFDWSGSRLTLRSADGTARVFIGRKSDGRMTLVDERPSGQVRTTFEKIAD